MYLNAGKKVLRWDSDGNLTEDTGLGVGAIAPGERLKNADAEALPPKVLAKLTNESDADDAPAPKAEVAPDADAVDASKSLRRKDN